MENYFLKSSILKYIKNNKNDIIATVKNNNLASIRIFNYSGFKIIKNEGKKIFLRKISIINKISLTYLKFLSSILFFKIILNFFWR